MTQARKYQVSLEETPFYHCHARCVRQAYLCGEDSVTGVSYEHRRQWIASRIRFLSFVYSIDVCAYAVMSNHYHVVLHVDKTRADNWSYEEIAERWTQLYKGTLLVQRWQKNPKAIGEIEFEAVKQTLEVYRKRLYDLGWFMRGINETIARMANEEDQTSGRFWEGRFKTQALLDEPALLSCMAYVDLNPVRAGLVKGTADSDFTSIQQRLFDHVKRKPVKNSTEKRIVKRVRKQRELLEDLEHQLSQTLKIKSFDLMKQRQAPLMSLQGSGHTEIYESLPFTKVDYFELVDATGRIIRDGKRGFIASNIPLVLQQLNISPDGWLENVKHFRRKYGRAAGSPERMKKYAKRFADQGDLPSENYKGLWCKGVSQSGKVYGAG